MCLIRRWLTQRNDIIGGATGILFPVWIFLLAFASGRVQGQGTFSHLWVKRMGAEADHISLSIVEIRFLGTALPHSCICFHGVALKATGKSQRETDDRQTG
jgi:hypothetical protein